MPTSTSNYGLQKPLVNNPTDSDLWGGYLNTDLDNVDVLIKTAMNLTPSTATTTVTVTAPTAASTTTGSSNTIYLCNATSGAFAANLPAASTASGMVVGFKKTDSTANAITITGNASDKIDGVGTYSLSAQYAYVILVCDGTNWDIIASTAPTGKSFSTNIQTFTASGTYTPTAGMVSCHIEVWGGGGAGGGSSGAGGGGGGGAGGYAKVHASSATIGASQTVTVGAAGGTSSVGSLASATGGSAGSTASSGTWVAGGAGGAGSVGDIQKTGSPGLPGGQTTVGSNLTVSGTGGSTSLGGAGIAPVGNGNVAGSAATANSGSGGSGGINGGAGGAGGTGYVVVTEFIYA